MLFSGANPTQALVMFSSIARCFDNAFTTGVPGGTCTNNNTPSGHKYKQKLTF
jgi:hypothetical protein